ncbi:GntR family transcriptional regulator [Achromobacter xylosoxidans]|uniref:GntR family transcriptional regulator n=1 Tax=Alcaligenes xylosoxydans xylosoxydans TaxID=85698 RepID=UPI001EEF0D4F|nr:GntR family transcriptional regulator [Achromobacter xylosoxidans]
MSQQPKVHDTSDFPIVRFDGASIYDGYGSAWCAEMDELVARGKPFVLIYVAGGPEEAQDDRVKRGVWLKTHKETLGDTLLALIHVEPEPAKRAQLEAMLPKLVQAFGTPQAARATHADAEALARHVLAGGRVEDTI